MTTRPDFPPGSYIGILGGGQLGKMSAMAAAKLGYKTVIWAPEGDNPAFDVTPHHVIGAYNDPVAFDRYRKLAQVTTLEFENVPVELLHALAKFMPVRPSAKILEITQNRWNEKTFFEQLGIPAAKTILITLDSSLDEIQRFCYPAILKTCRLGYDGKGQKVVYSWQEARDAWHAFDTQPCVLEEMIDLHCEMSVIVARAGRQMALYPPIENKHEGGILRTSRCPGKNIPEEAEGQAYEIAERIARRLGLQGLLAVEMFVAKDGQVLANELAPRPHNSGHGTIEACAASQFEQHIRAVCGLSLGTGEPHSGWEMHNLLGDEASSCPIPSFATRSLHLYGKKEARPGRKMGHVTEIFHLVDQ